jgi:hypothetical protein
MASLKEKEDEFTVTDWHKYLPVLNPIENVWAHMMLKLKSRKLKNLQELNTAITAMWVDDMPYDYFKKFSASMPKRLKLVLERKGNMTKY